MMSSRLKFICGCFIGFALPVSSDAPSLVTRYTENVSIKESYDENRTYLDKEWQTSGCFGAWGQIEYRRFYLDTPLESYPAKPLPQSVTWHAGPMSARHLDELVLRGPFSAEEKSLWRNTCLTEEKDKTLRIYPSAAFRWNLSSQSRSLFYSWLALQPENLAQRYAFTHADNDEMSWLKTAGIRPRLIASVKQLSYRIGTTTKFADFDLLEPLFDSPEERYRLYSSLNRQPYCQVRVRIPNSSALRQAFMDYWRLEDRSDPFFVKTYDQPSGNGQYIQLDQLLPALPSKILNTFPDTNGDLLKTGKKNCFWTALNFFNRIPDSRLCEADAALETLYRAYQPVWGSLQFGDVIFMVDDQGLPYHAAVYLAADLVFTKNGGDDNRPWVIMKLHDMENLYADKRYRVTCYRRKPFTELIDRGPANFVLNQNEQAGHFVFQPNRPENGQYTK